MITIYASTILALMGVATAWDRYDLPRLAYKSEVSEVQSYAVGTRKLVLNQEWFRVTAELKEKRARLDANPSDWELIQAVTRLEQYLKDIEDQLAKIKNREN